MNTSLCETNLTDRIALSLLPSMDIDLAQKLLSNFGSVTELMNAPESEVKALGNIPKSVISIQKRFQALQQAADEVVFIKKNNIKALWFKSPEYPQRLLKAQRPPILIYTLGDLDLNALKLVGIVGTRHATAYGVSVTESIVKYLAENHDSIGTVSGLAYGIDVTAHSASLKANIPTIGIVGHGLNRIYPSAHRDIASRMVRQGGMLLSDYDHNSSINSYNFLSRNRLIAALSDVLVVVESGSEGGALATARLATKCGTKVMAVPGRISDNYSAGCNRLIASGMAQSICSPADITDAMKWLPKASLKTDSQPTSTLPQLTAEEKQLLHLILTRPECDNDMLVASTNMSASKIMTIMIGLEMKEIVTTTPGNRYQVIQTIDYNSLL